MKKYLMTLGILTIFKMVAVPLWLSNSCGKAAGMVGQVNGTRGRCIYIQYH